MNQWASPSVLMLIGFIFLISSCDQRGCEDQCNPRQECVNGECVCPNGYEGSNCQIESRDKFIGQYQVYKNCHNSGTSESYNTYISPGNNVENVVIKNMINTGLTAEAVVRGDYIKIPEQKLGATQIYGQGNYNEGSQTIDLEITYTQGGTAKNCNCSYQKR